MGRTGGGTHTDYTDYTHARHSQHETFCSSPVIYTHTCPHLLIRHGQLVLATAKRRAGGRGNGCMGAGRWWSGSGRKKRGDFTWNKGGCALYNTIAQH